MLRRYLALLRKVRALLARFSKVVLKRHVVFVSPFNGDAEWKLEGDPGVFEVEFTDNDGRAYASLALKGTQLLVLYYQP